jgi:peptidoglycan/LPS O-acetylase OafA/YrhL
MNMIQEKDYLNAFRGFAILSVICVHAYLATDYIQRYLNRATSTDLSFFSWGRFGVSDFFLLSGYLIAMKNDSKSYRLGNYALKRFVRIYPLWLLFLILQIVKAKLGFTDGWVGWGISSDSDSWWINSIPVIAILALTFCLWFSETLWNSVIPGGWSIQSEVLNYMLYPIIRLKSESFVLLLLTVINCLSIILNQLFVRNETLRNTLFFELFLAYLRLNLAASFGYFFLGVIAFRVMTKKNLRRLSNEKSKITMFNSIFLIFCISFVALPSVSGPQYESIAFIFLSLVMVRLTVTLKPIRAFLIMLGKYSYFLFYSHIQILSAISFFATKMHPNLLAHDDKLLFLELIIFTITTSIVFGKISGTYIERPITNYLLR